MQVTKSDQTSFGDAPRHFKTGDEMVGSCARNKSFSQSVQKIGGFEADADKKNQIKSQRRISIGKIQPWMRRETFFEMGRRKKENARQKKKVPDLIEREAPKNLLRMFCLNRIFNLILKKMDGGNCQNKNNHDRVGQVGSQQNK